MKYIPSMETMQGESSFCQARVCRVWHWSQEAAISYDIIYLNIWLIYVLVCMVGSQPMDCRILMHFCHEVATEKDATAVSVAHSCTFLPHCVGSVPWAPSDLGLVHGSWFDYTIQMKRKLIQRSIWITDVFDPFWMTAKLLSEQRSEDGIQILVALFYVRVFTVKPTKVGWILGKGSMIHQCFVR